MKPENDTDFKASRRANKAYFTLLFYRTDKNEDDYPSK